ncbi:hypothetical protein, partial [Cupriavidus sp. WS]|uniref:hypothetical protein n=1 Tax=Cupriavidus sp. WS TaxID=1312922 RepID=UPI001E3AAE38
MMRVSCHGTVLRQARVARKRGQQRAGACSRHAAGRRSGLPGRGLPGRRRGSWNGKTPPPGEARGRAAEGAAVRAGG